MEKFLIFDSNSLIHRAFHALPALNDKQGRPTQAVYGFFSMFLKSVNEFKPKYIAACFDVKGKNFRHEQYADYKAHRQKAPDELYGQIQPVKDILNVFNVSVLAEQGLEADDLIASLTEKVKDRVEVIIVSGDMDNTQLIEKNVKVYGLGKGFKETILFDEARTIERFGVKPSQIVDYKALAGDSSDNIPGGKGIGPKAAQTLIEKYGGVKEMFRQIEEGEAWDMPDKTKTLVLSNKELILTSYDLALMKRDAFKEINLQDFSWKEYKKEDLEKIFKEYSFYSLINRLP